MLVIVGTRSAEHSLRSQVGIRSESHCLLGQLNKTLRDFRFRSRLRSAGQGFFSEKKVNAEMMM